MVFLQQKRIHFYISKISERISILFHLNGENRTRCVRYHVLDGKFERNMFKIQLNGINILSENMRK